MRWGEVSDNAKDETRTNGQAGVLGPESVIMRRVRTPSCFGDRQSALAAGERY